LLFFRAWVYCAGVRVALWVMPSTALLRFVRRKVESPRASRPRSDALVDRIGWSVRAAGRRVPRSTCLVEALSVQLLLARHGHRSDLRIGVARDEDHRFTAHAWVEVQGRIVVGARREIKYTALTDLQRLIG
jgi:hypothetical protein